MNLLTVNAGSSSLKFAFFATHPVLDKALQGQFERVGKAPFVRIQDAEGAVIARADLPTGSGHSTCLEWLAQWLASRAFRIDAVAHRVVHGGTEYKAPVRVTPAVLEQLDQFTALAPLHQPHNLAGIRYFSERNPELPQVACFDTAFHTTQEEHAQMFALPRALFDQGVRAYGFHGLSYDFISRQPALTGMDRVIVLHLGSGSSACALRHGRSIASTMGFTALDGLVMGTRCGSLDPGVVLHLLRNGRSIEDVETLLYKQSGLLGVSGLSSDNRDLEAAAIDGNVQAQQALDMYADSVAGHVARLMTRLGGADAVVFTAGIGENSPQVRERICNRLAWTGLKLDAAANAASQSDLTGQGSAIRVLRLATNEELMMALHASKLLEVPVSCSVPRRTRCAECANAL